MALSLPWLEAMAAPTSPGATPRRMVAVGTFYGFVPDKFFPKDAGFNYTLSPLLQSLAPLKNDFTVFSNLDHGANAVGGHQGTHAFLSGILNKNAKNYPNRNVTVDQVAAESIGSKTRYPSLQLSPETQSSFKVSYSRAGVGLNPIQSLDEVYRLLFGQEDMTKIAHRSEQFGEHLSILDVISDDAKRFQHKIGATDKERLDQYFTSIRSLEKSLVQSEAWLHVQKPKTKFKVPSNSDRMDYKKRVPLFYDLMVLALQTDATRVISLELSEIGPNSGGFNISRGYHTLSHHGKVESYLKELNIIEEFNMKSFSDFLMKLKAIKEPNGKTLLDSTMALMGTGLANASSHSNKNLPLILAGGGFKHGQHLVSPKNKATGLNTPATNLYLSMLQRFGVERDEYNLSTGTLTGLDFA